MNSANDQGGRSKRIPPTSVPRETSGSGQGGQAVIVSRETQERLGQLLALVRQWNPVVNLVGRGDLAVLEGRHLADSLRLLPLLPRGLYRAIDLGSGAGFPGLVLAVASDLQFDLIESDQRKAAFLAEAAMRIGASARVVARRIEDAGVAPARLLTARALAPLPKLLELAAPLLTDDGECLFLKGRDAAAEIEAASQDWSFSCAVTGDAAEGGVVLRVGGIARRAGTPPSHGRLR